VSKSFSYKSFGTSSTPALVDAARPALAVVSVGRDSPYGHPHAEVLARWRAAGAQVLTTGERGAITVSTDGEDLKVETFVRLPEAGRTIPAAGPPPAAGSRR
jgi:beta-lactamase superfamily II metal-dependent hydrolase